jgi:hypothetical protein
MKSLCPATGVSRGNEGLFNYLLFQSHKTPYDPEAAEVHCIDLPLRWDSIFEFQDWMLVANKITS